MNVLVAFECSGAVRRAFRALGHDAWSCDLKPATDGSPYHIQGDAMEAIWSRGWDIIIMHPMCTALSLSGNAHYAVGKPKHQERLKAIDYTMKLWCTAKQQGLSVCMENPKGILSLYIGKPQQTVQPYEFGDDASKATCFWLHALDPLEIIPEQRFPGRWVEYRGKMVERWSNQTDSGQNRLGPSATRAAERAVTYPGIAAAMARNWGK